MIRKGFLFGIGVLAALAAFIFAIGAIHVAAIVGISAYKSRHNLEKTSTPPAALESTNFVR